MGSQIHDQAYQQSRQGRDMGIRDQNNPHFVPTGYGVHTSSIIKVFYMVNTSYSHGEAICAH